MEHIRGKAIKDTFQGGIHVVCQKIPTAIIKESSIPGNRTTTPSFCDSWVTGFSGGKGAGVTSPISDLRLYYMYLESIDPWGDTRLHLI